MKPIFYKNKKDSECFKVELHTKNLKTIDTILDVLNPEKTVFITEEEFENKYKKLMTIDIMDIDEMEVIGQLTTKDIELEEANYVNWL